MSRLITVSNEWTIINQSRDEFICRRQKSLPIIKKPQVSLSEDLRQQGKYKYFKIFMEYTPVYVPYRQRMWKLLRISLIVNLLVFVFALSYGNYSFLVPAIVIIVLYKRAQKLNVNYLHELIVDVSDKYVEIEVFKYDSFLYRRKIAMDSCYMKLDQINSGITIIHQLEIGEKNGKNKPIFKQTTTGAWNIKYFVEIYELFKQTKGEKTNITWLKKMIHEERY